MAPPSICSDSWSDGDGVADRRCWHETGKCGCRELGRAVARQLAQVRRRAGRRMQEPSQGHQDSASGKRSKGKSGLITGDYEDRVASSRGMEEGRDWVLVAVYTGRRPQRDPAREGDDLGFGFAEDRTMGVFARSCR